MSVAILDSLKALGKQISWVGALNSRYKSTRLKQEYERTLAHYRQRNVPAPLESGLRGKTRSFGLGGKPRLFFIGTDELQDRSGILQALERIAERPTLTGCKRSSPILRRQGGFQKYS
jgi:hypothetical protein